MIVGKKKTRPSTLCDSRDLEGSTRGLWVVRCGAACLCVLGGSIKEKGIPAFVIWEIAESLLIEPDLVGDV
jgi:hypothetical protein